MGLALLREKKKVLKRGRAYSQRHNKFCSCKRTLFCFSLAYVTFKWHTLEKWQSESGIPFSLFKLTSNAPTLKAAVACTLFLA